MPCTALDIVDMACNGSTIINFAVLSGLALTVSAVMLAALYLWSVMFRNPQLTGYVKGELYELVISALLVIFIAGAVQSMSSLNMGSFTVDPMLLPQGVTMGTSIYEAAYMYYDQVHDDMSSWLSMNYALSMYIDQLASVTPYARPLGVGLVASPMAGFAAPLKQLLYNMSVALAIAFIINSASQIVYLFALQAFLVYYLPAGIFLRNFTPTRRLGGAIIGISLTFLFAFPALSVINYVMFYNQDSGPLVSFRNMVDHYFTDTTSGFYAKMERFYSNNFTDVGSGVTGFISGVFGGLGQLLTNLVGGLLLTIMMFPISVVSYAFAIGFIMPAINIMILSQIAKSLSMSFGEEVDISSLTRMI